MERMNESLKYTTNYLISLFYRTDCRYSCSRTKIGKLLSIVAFSYACENRQLFAQPIYRYDDCGTGIRELKFWMGIEEYSFFGSNICCDDKEMITEDFNNDKILPNRLQVENFVPCELKERVENVFRQFGSYAGWELNDSLNAIAKQATHEPFGIVDLTKISSIVENMDQDNEIVDYLKSNYIKGKKVKTKIK